MLFYLWPTFLEACPGYPHLLLSIQYLRVPYWIIHSYVITTESFSVRLMVKLHVSEKEKADVVLVLGSQRFLPSSSRGSRGNSQQRIAGFPAPESTYLFFSLNISDFGTWYIRKSSVYIADCIR